MAALDGLHVVLTRPAERNQALADALRQQGASPHEIPLLHIEPSADSPARRTLCQQLDHYQKVIAVSQTAVAYGLPVLEQYWPQWPLGVDWYAVGETTAAALADWGLDARWPARQDSEGLLALFGEPPVAAGERVLIVRGEGGRTLLSDTLRDLGARVDHLEVYRRLPPALSAEALKTRWPKKADAIVALSGETLEQLHRLTLAAGIDISGARILVPSERVAEQARAMNMPVTVLPSVREAAIIEALKHIG